MNNYEVIPAILPKDFKDLEEKIKMIIGGVPVVHIDATDGSMTPGKTWPYALGEKVEVPFKEEFNFEAHLMVLNPGRIIDDWVKAGAERVIFQIEAFQVEDSIDKLIQTLRDRSDAGSSYLGLEIGLAVNLNTPLSRVMPYIDRVDFLHLMSIAEIGRQGNPFDNRIYERITELKKDNPELIISIDGGVGLDNAEELLHCGADRLIVGSAIFKAENPEQVLEDLKNLVHV
ncbi:hypothetical protein KW790_02010 [Candidatus Parcubacteria bacterium]|nr:hypothetical protein [Candidatus Parcubacteria bacterium]